MNYKTKGDILLLGDLNGRVGNLPDYITNDNDKYLPFDDNYNIDTITTPRNSQDSYVDERGKHILEICVASQMRILNGRTIGDFLGSPTSYHYNGFATIDYALASSSILQDISYFKVHKFVGAISDHCLISLMLKATPNYSTEKIIKLNDLPKQFNWSDSRQTQFANIFNFPVFKKNIKELNKLTSECSDKHSINIATEKLTSLISEAAKLTLKTKGSKSKPTKRKPWTTTQIKRLEKEVQKR